MEGTEKGSDTSVEVSFDVASASECGSGSRSVSVSCLGRGVAYVHGDGIGHAYRDGGDVSCPACASGDAASICGGDVSVKLGEKV